MLSNHGPTKMSNLCIKFVYSWETSYSILYIRSGGFVNHIDLHFVMISTLDIVTQIEVRKMSFFAILFIINTSIWYNHVIVY
jgi:hypothetical protein